MHLPFFFFFKTHLAYSCLLMNSEMINLESVRYKLRAYHSTTSHIHPRVYCLVRSQLLQCSDVHSDDISKDTFPRMHSYCWMTHDHN